MSIPPEIVAGLDHYRVAAPLRDLLGRVATFRSITADPPGVGYVAVRPSAWGNVSAYFHAAYVDVALIPSKAREVEQSQAWPIIKINSETGFVRIREEDLRQPEALDVATVLLLAAVDKSEAGTAYEGGSAHRATKGAEPKICPTCGLALPATGICDDCG